MMRIRHATPFFGESLAGVFLDCDYCERVRLKTCHIIYLQARVMGSASECVVIGTCIFSRASEMPVSDSVRLIAGGGDGFHPSLQARVNDAGFGRMPQHQDPCRL